MPSRASSSRSVAAVHKKATCWMLHHCKKTHRLPISTPLRQQKKSSSTVIAWGCQRLVPGQSLSTGWCPRRLARAVLQQVQPSLPWLWLPRRPRKCRDCPRQSVQWHFSRQYERSSQLMIIYSGGKQEDWEGTIVAMMSKTRLCMVRYCC